MSQAASFLNNATIENAHEAISTRGAEDSTLWDKTGGIVQATNTLFRNNRRSAEFLTYENHKANGTVTNNVGFFTRCTFTGFCEAIHAANTDGSYDITIDNCDFARNQTGVSLNAADNVRVSFCDFNLLDSSSCGVYLSTALATSLRTMTFTVPPTPFRQV